MTKEEKVFVFAYGEALLGAERRNSNMVQKWVKYKIVRPGREPVYVISAYPDDVCTKLMENGFRRDVKKVWG